MPGGELSLTTLEESVRARPDDPRAWLSYAMALHREGDVDRCVQCIRQAASLGRDNPVVLTWVGELFEHIGALPEALAAARRATHLSDPPPEAAALAGRLLTQLGDAEAAALTLRVAVTRHPDSAPLRVALGQALLASDRAQDATEQAERAVMLAPDDPAAHRLSAQLHSQRGNQDAYMASLGRVAALDDNDASASVALGAQLAARGQRAEALSLLTSAAARTPKTAQAQLKLGIGFREARALAAAIRHLKEAIRLQPDLAEAHLQLGISFREAGSVPDAVASLRKAALLAADNPHYQYELGLALLEAGQPREAATVLIRAAAFDPEDEAIQDALTTALNRTRVPKDNAPVSSGLAGSFTGDLKLFSVAELLDFLQNQRATGTLTVRGPTGDGHVELYKGEILAARHPGSKPLSQHLLESDMITHTDLRRSVIDSSDLDRDGVIASVLAARNLVDKRSLEDLIRRHVLEALFEMLNWTEGDAVFQREASQQAWPEPPEIRIDTRWALIETTRRIDEHRAKEGSNRLRAR